MIPQRRFIIGIVAAFFVFSGLVYGQAVVTSEFVRWDDGMLVFENPVIREITPRSVGRIFSMYDPELYIPLTFLSYQIDYQIGGIAPLQYHLTSFLFHTLNALLVAWFAALFYCRSKTCVGREGQLMGIFCGLLFLLHPLHTEAIMWVSGRKDLLAGFFFLLTLIQWLRWRDEPVRRRYLLAVAFFGLALLSKIVAVTLPVILVLLDWRDAQGAAGRSGAAPLRMVHQWMREMIADKIPFFALSVIFGLIGVGGKTSVVASSSTWEKIIMAGKSSMFYLQKIVWPDHFSLLYPYHKDVSITSPDFYVPIVLWLIIGVLVLLSVKKTRDIAFGFVFYFVTLAPTFLNFTKGGDLDVYFASDRYAYLPSIGIFIALTGAVMFFMNFFQGRIIRQGAAGIACVIIIAIAYLSHQQSKVWANTYTLLSNVLVHYPDSHVAHNNIGNARRLEGKLDDAIGEFEKALAIKPHPKIYANLGAVYRKQGKIIEALAVYEKALMLNPDSKDAYMGRGLVRMAEKNYPAAEADFQKAISINQTYLEAHANLGAAYMAQGKIDDAIREYRIALVINPFFPDASYNLGVALMQTGDDDGAMDAFATTISGAPAFIPARINYALLLYKAGEEQAAVDQFREVLRIDPENASALKALSQIGI